MADDFTYCRSNYHGEGGRWPVEKTGRRAPRLNYPKLDVEDLAAIERLINLRGMDGELRIWYFRPRTQKVARCRLFDPDASHKSLGERVKVALAGSPYSLLGVSREYEYGWPWIIEVVVAPGEFAGASSFAGLGGGEKPARAKVSPGADGDGSSTTGGAVSRNAPPDLKGV